MLAQGFQQTGLFMAINRAEEHQRHISRKKIHLG